MAVRGTRPRTPEAAAIRYATDILGWDYERLADEMRRATGDDSWKAGMFERIALGRRKVHTRELRPLSDVLGIPVDFLVRGPQGADLVPSRRTTWNADIPADLRFRLLRTGAKDILCRAA